MTGPAVAAPRPGEVDIDALIERYEALLFDAYGVLIDHGGALPGSVDLVARLNREERQFYVVTNDASRSIDRTAARFCDMGLPIAAAQIINSGSLIGPYFEANRLRGARCVVLGPEDSQRQVELAGGVLVGPDQQADVLVVCDEVGYPFVETVDEVLSLLFRAFDAQRPIRLVLPNPDFIYPKSRGRYGFAAGSIALILEEALRRRYPGRQDTAFVRLGKPNPPIFEEAIRRAGTRDLVMIGDQLATDIAGAIGCGIDSALVTTGLSSLDDPDIVTFPPTYFLRSLQ